jgi:uncharacterized OB-fold protein
MAEQDVHVVEGRLRVPYNNWYGSFITAFFRELRDHKRLRGTRCRSCDKVHMPPRPICPKCFSRLDEWVDLPETGTLLTYTIVHSTYGKYYQPMEPPYPLGIIKLDGADTGMCHLLGEVSQEDISIGMRLLAVFREERRGNILDIAYFKPL